MAGEAVVAIASARGRSARAVIRMAGSELARFLLARFEPASTTWDPEDRGSCVGWWIVPAHGWRVPVDVWTYKAPRSVTGTDVVELLVPGSPALAEAIVRDLIGLGAGLAAPGAFTRLAVMNGRLDLAQADAVMALIRARDDADARAAHQALEGGDSRMIESLEDALVDLLIPLESALDFSDQDVAGVIPDDLAVRASELAARLDAAVAAANGRTRRGLPRVVLIGAANAGKSTLWNALTGGAALTASIPGTTRDALEREGTCAGMSVLWVDTAGIDGPRGDVDDLGHAMRERQVRGADLLVGVADARSCDFPEGCALRVATHLDLVREIPADAWGVCAPSGEGLDAFRAAVAERLRRGSGDAPVAFSLRVAEGLRDAAVVVRRGIEALASHPPEFAASDWREAQRLLRRLRFAEPGDPVLDRIFASWCIGK